ncbi:MAG: peptidylprolyl isomerase, partial [Azonexus sp.]
SGYALFKLVKLNAGEALDDARKQALVRQLNTLEAQEEVHSYLAALRNRYKVEINTAALEAKEK